MPWKYLEEEAIADIGISVEAETIEELLRDACLSIANLMTKVEELDGKEERELTFEASSIETLLYKIMDEMVYLKDAELFFIKDVEIKVEGTNAEVRFVGGLFDRDVHMIGNDIKAITLHDFYVKKLENKWIAHFIIDI